MAEHCTDWATLWRELALRFRRPSDGPQGSTDLWKERASELDALVKRRARSGLDLLVESLMGRFSHADTVVDVAAGTGS